MDALFATAGLLDGQAVQDSGGGPRKWPPQVVGSISHKGTIVAVALAPTTALEAVGIDIELDGQDLTRVEHILSPEPLPSRLDKNRALLLAFSMKEAIYKAVRSADPSIRRFRDAHLSWHPGSTEVSAEISLNAHPRLKVKAQSYGRWVVSVAYLPAVEKKNEPESRN